MVMRVLVILVFVLGFPLEAFAKCGELVDVIPLEFETDVMDEVRERFGYENMPKMLSERNSDFRAGDPTNEDGELKYRSAFYDLNMDGEEELLLEVSGAGLCGSSGCLLEVWEKRDGVPIRIMEARGEHKFFEVNAEVSNGYHELVKGSENWKFENGKYVFECSVLSAGAYNEGWRPSAEEKKKYSVVTSFFCCFGPSPPYDDVVQSTSILLVGRVLSRSPRDVRYMDRPVGHFCYVELAVEQQIKGFVDSRISLRVDYPRSKGAGWARYVSMRDCPYEVGERYVISLGGESHDGLFNHRISQSGDCGHPINLVKNQEDVVELLPQFFDDGQVYSSSPSLEYILNN